MKNRRVSGPSAAFSGVLVAAALLPALPAQAPLEPPALLAPCQAEYGPKGTVVLAWTNAESYEAVELSVDGVPAPGEVDGSFASARVQAGPGRRSFGVRGLVGERASAWATADFTVRDESPIPRPISGLDCELVPGVGGRLKLTWKLGTDAWVSGTAAVPGTEVSVPIEQGALGIEVPLGPAGAARPEGEPRVARLTFKTADGYLSPPFEPLCIARTPAFRRGDCDSSGRVNITDPVFVLNHLFLGKARWRCDDACDSNDDGKVDLSDAVVTLGYLFQGQIAPPPPGPVTCGVDPTPDYLGGACGCP
ncbi:MAG: hypothetical protein HY721_07095 [Planctomycetes bacterium]|nr:hypothetical protein [Planctomycetota bacterium]